MDLGEGAKVKIRSVRSDQFQDKLEELQRPHKKRIRRGTLPKAEQEALAAKLFAMAVIVDWKGITEEGKPFKYNTSNAERLMREYVKMADWVTDFAKDDDNFIDASQEEAIDELKK